MNGAMQPVPNDDPVMIAWRAYIATDDYQNSKNWALQIAPMVHAGDPDGELKRRHELMPFGQRAQHVEGSLWAAFIAGWAACTVSAQQQPNAAATDVNEAGA